MPKSNCPDHEADSEAAHTEEWLRRDRREFKITLAIIIGGSILAVAAAISVVLYALGAWAE
jgi:hypothetical protein